MTPASIASFPRQLRGFFLCSRSRCVRFLVQKLAAGVRCQDLATQVFLLTVLVEVLYKEIHGNHLLWFFPLGALLFCWGWRRAMLTGTEYERVS